MMPWRTMTSTGKGRTGWRLDLRSLALGMAIAGVPLAMMDQAEAFDLGGLAKSITNLVNIKKNLDGDVKALTANATTLMGDKDKLLQIKDQLLKLSKDTKAQIDSIQAVVGEVEGHLKKTQQDIATTAGHVNEIDQVRKALSGK